MKITILGSGTGTPYLQRNAAGLLIEQANKNLVFDTGPGIVRKLLELGITYHDIDHIFYTHFHTDHTLDLATLLFAAKYALSLRTKRLDIIGSSDLKKFYNDLLSLYGDVIRPEAYEVALQQIGEQSLEFDTYKVTALGLQHEPGSLGYRVESQGKAVVYSGDTDVCENIVKLGQNADALILDCSFPDEMKVKGHLVPQEAAEIAAQCKCKRLILSHLYPVCQQEHITKQAQKKFKGEITVAQDLMSFAL